MMSRLLVLLLAQSASVASALATAPRLTASPRAAVLSSRAQPAQMLQGGTKNAAVAMLSAAILANAAPTLTRAVVEPPAVVQQYGSSMVADASAEDLREAQAEFLAKRAAMKQTYDTDTDSTYVKAGEFENKKNIYIVVVGGLVVIAFIAPMLQFFYYTGGD